MSGTTPEPDPPLFIEGLRCPDAYEHPVDSVVLAETHISWVLLAGEFAYKIKKPVDFGFLDFTTLERRKFYCEEELRLNRRYAPDLYLAVVPVTGDTARPRIGGPGVPLDYAVKMRRFDPSQTFDHLASAQTLRPAYLDALAETLAAFHASTARATPEDDHGLPDHQRRAAEFNFTTIRPNLDDAADIARLEVLHAWTHEEYARREALFWQRKREGFIRECHGDLHLGNIVLMDGNPTLFDGIEFNEDLRWIDVLNELAFLVMDLESNGATKLAWRLLNHYLAIAGDYEGMALFDYYRLYRALVRAKIALLTRSEIADVHDRAALLARYRTYVDYGVHLISPRKARLFITYGLSGSGKSYLSGQLAQALPAIHLRSDVERKRLAGLAMRARTHSAEASDVYGAEMTEKTYRRLVDLAEILLNAGYSVTVDATFLRREQRDEQRQLAERCGADFLILDCRAPDELLRQRIQERAATGRDPSEADSSILDYQMVIREPLADDEWGYVRVVDMDNLREMDRGGGVIALALPMVEFGLDRIKA